MFVLLSLMLLCVGTLGCQTIEVPIFSQASDYSYPRPPSIGTHEQQERLAQLARDVSSEIDDDKRHRLLADLATHVRQLLPEQWHDLNYDKVGRFVAETALVSFIKRQYADDAANPDVQGLSERVPAELVALLVTAPRHWVQPGALLIRREATVTDRALTSAGVFERNGQAGHFEHAYAMFGMDRREGLRRLHETADFDQYVNTVYSKDRLAAAKLFLGFVPPRPHIPEETAADEKRRADITAELRDVQALLLRVDELRRLEARVKGYGLPTKDIRDQLEGPLDEEIRKALLGLARHPDWAVHLFIYSAMYVKDEWQTPKLLEAVRAHAHPISLRFFEMFPLDAPTPGSGAKLDT